MSEDEITGKAKGGTEVNVGVQVNVDPWQLYQRALEEVEVDEIEERIREVENAGKRNIKVGEEVRGEGIR